MLEQIEKRYNPENDMRPDGPVVTWAEYDLFLEVMKLNKRIGMLEKEIQKEIQKLKLSVRDAMSLAGGESLE